MSEKFDITLTINGHDHAIRVEARKTLVDAIREDCGQTGTHIGCEHGICGTCTVILDDAVVRSCLMFAVQAQGKKIRTVEGLANGDELHPLQRAFITHHGLQCGFQYVGAEPRHRRRRSARHSLVQPVPLHRLSKYHQGGARRGNRDARYASDGMRWGTLASH
jgi:2Fe-2S iron-sulfur cluster binding domain